MNRKAQPDDMGSTNWSNLGLAVQGDRQALERLLQVYLTPLRVWGQIRFRLSPDKADEFAQEFVTQRILQGDLLAQAQPQRGRFRHLLRRALMNFISSQLSKEHHRQHLLNSALEGGEVPCTSAEPAFEDAADISWAHAMVGAAVDAMKLDCLAKNQTHLWETFYGRFWHPLISGEPPRSFEAIASSLDMKTPQQARLALWTARKKFNNFCLRILVDDSGDISQAQEELDEMVQILGRDNALQDSLLRELFLEHAVGSTSTLESLTAGSLHVAGFLKQMSTVRPPDQAAIQEEELLELSVSEFVQLSGSLPEREKEALLPPAERLQSLFDLFTDAEATFPTLLLVKDAARRSCSDDNPHISRDLALAVYYLAIAAAHVTGGRSVMTQVTSLSAEKRQEGLAFLANQAWMPDILREMVRKAQATL